MHYCRRSALQDVARFRRLSGATFEGIMVHERGFVLDANRTLATMFRCEVSELIQQKIVVESLATPEFKRWFIRIFSQYETITSSGFEKDGSKHQ